MFCCWKIAEWKKHWLCSLSLWFGSFAVERPVIKKPTGQVGRGSQLCVKSREFKNPHPELRSLSLNLWERACHKLLNPMKSPVLQPRVQVSPVWLIWICLPLSLLHHGQWADYKAEQLQWRREKGKREGIERGSRQKQDSHINMWQHMWLNQDKAIHIFEKLLSAVKCVKQSRYKLDFGLSVWLSDNIPSFFFVCFVRVKWQTLIEDYKKLGGR